MKAVRKDYFLDHDHSAYVDQWDWERTISAEDRTLDYLKDTVRKIWSVIVDAGKIASDMYPALAEGYPPIPEELYFIHAEDLLEMYPDLPRKQRETKLIQEHPAVFIIGIGQSRTYMYLLRKAHIGEVSVTVWPDDLTRICEERNIHVLR